MTEAQDGLKKAGASGDIFVAAHSLGTVMAQNYTIKHASNYKGQIFMGGSLLRSMRENNNQTGHSHMVHPLPTLVLAGAKDGLYRISRNAESYWHQVQNIDPAQKGKYPVVLLKGVTHGSFMDETMLPLLVKKDDLKPEVTQAAAYKMVAQNMVSFIAGVRGEEDIA